METTASSKTEILDGGDVGSTQQTQDDVYQTKIKTMQKYVSFLDQLVQKLEQDSQNDESNLIQMKLLQNILVNAEETKVSMAELNKCEEVLEKLYKVQDPPENLQNEEDSTNSESVEIGENKKSNSDSSNLEDQEKENISGTSNVADNVEQTSKCAENCLSEKDALETTKEKTIATVPETNNAELKESTTQDDQEKSDKDSNIKQIDPKISTDEPKDKDSIIDDKASCENTENEQLSTAEPAQTIENVSEHETDDENNENVEYIGIPEENDCSSSEMILPDSADELEEVSNEKVNDAADKSTISPDKTEVADNNKNNNETQDDNPEEPELVSLEAQEDNPNETNTNNSAEDDTNDPLNSNPTKTNDMEEKPTDEITKPNPDNIEDDDDDVEVIETRNSPICIESDSDNETDQNAASQNPPKIAETIANSRPTRTFARKSTAAVPQTSMAIPQITPKPKNFSYLQKQPPQYRKRVGASVETIELIDSSDEESNSKKQYKNMSSYISPTKRRLLPVVAKSKPQNAQKRPMFLNVPSSSNAMRQKSMANTAITPKPIFVATPQSNFLQAVNLQPAHVGQNPAAFSAQLSNKNVIIPNAFYGNPPDLRAKSDAQEARGRGRPRNSTAQLNIEALGSNQNLEKIYVRWLENFMHNFANPQQLASSISYMLLQRVLKNKTFARIKEARQNIASADDTINIQLLLELRGAFLNSNKQLTPGGKAFCEAACFYKPTNNNTKTVALTSCRRSGVISCRTKTAEEVQLEIQAYGPAATTPTMPSSTSTASSQSSECSLTLAGTVRKRQRDDQEYTPKKQVAITVAKEKLGERKSLRSTRGRKVVDKVFSYNEDELVDFDDSDDDSEEAVQRRIEQKRMQAKRQTQQQAKSFENAFIQTFSKSLKEVTVGTLSNPPKLHYINGQTGSSVSNKKQTPTPQNDPEDLLSLPDDEDFEGGPREHRIYKVIPSKLISATQLSPPTNSQKKSRGRPRKELITFDDAEDNSNSNGNDPVETEDEVVVIKSNSVKIDPTSAPPNVNKNNLSVSSQAEWCVICNRRVPRIVHHYVNEHPGCEVYCSRLSDKQVDSLRRNNVNAKPSLYKNGQLQYESECLFCAKVSRFMLPYWYQHYAMHTGEYAYRCDGCNIRKPTRSLLMAHTGQPCPKGGKICQDYSYENKSIEARVCMLCNYVQLNRGNVMNHIRTQHKIKNVLPRHIQSIFLLRIVNPEQAGGSGARQSLPPAAPTQRRYNKPTNYPTSSNTTKTTVRKTIGNAVFEISEIEDDSLEAAAGYWPSTSSADNSYYNNPSDSTGMMTNQWGEDDGDGGYDLSYMICGMLDVEMKTTE